MSDYTPPAAPPLDGNAVILEPMAPLEPHTFTEQEVGDYKEQDRYLPVGAHVAVSVALMQIRSEH
jgi:hypothetical protein